MTTLAFLPCEARILMSTTANIIVYMFDCRFVKFIFKFMKPRKRDEMRIRVLLEELGEPLAVDDDWQRARSA